MKVYKRPSKRGSAQRANHFAGPHFQKHTPYQPPLGKSATTTQKVSSSYPPKSISAKSCCFPPRLIWKERCSFLRLLQKQMEMVHCHWNSYSDRYLDHFVIKYFQKTSAASSRSFTRRSEFSRSKWWAFWVFYRVKMTMEKISHVTIEICTAIDTSIILSSNASRKLAQLQAAALNSTERLLWYYLYTCWCFLHQFGWNMHQIPCFWWSSRKANGLVYIYT